MKIEDEGKPQPQGTQFLGLIDSLIDMFKDPGISHVEVFFVSFKLDEKGKNIQKAGKNLASIHAVAIGGLNTHIREELRKLSESDSLISQMVLYRDASTPKQLGILKFRSMAPGTKMGYKVRATSSPFLSLRRCGPLPLQTDTESLIDLPLGVLTLLRGEVA